MIEKRVYTRHSAILVHEFGVVPRPINEKGLRLSKKKIVIISVKIVEILEEAIRKILSNFLENIEKF